MGFKLRPFKKGFAAFAAHVVTFLFGFEMFLCEMGHKRRRIGKSFVTLDAFEHIGASFAFLNVSNEGCGFSKDFVTLDALVTIVMSVFMFIQVLFVKEKLATWLA